MTSLLPATRLWIREVGAKRAGGVKVRESSVDWRLEANGIRDVLVSDRRWLHQHPEIGFDLDATCDYVRNALTEMGYEVSEPCKSGLLCSVGSEEEGPCILLRADMDALPMSERTGLAFASSNGNMHSCGHDMHTAMMLGVARLLRAHEESLHGCIKLLFQPDEEATAPVDTTGGAAVVEGGVLDGPHVDAAVSVHVNPAFPVGELYIRPGTMFSSVDDVEIRVQGRSSHGSEPQRGVDALNVACHVFLGLENLVAREFAPGEKAPLTIGRMSAGSAANILPGDAEMLGTLRTVSEEVRARVFERVPALCDGIARGFGATAEARFLRPAPTTQNDPTLLNELSGYLEQAGMHPHDLPEPFAGSDDFGVISQRVPSVYFILGASIGEPEETPTHMLHNPNVLINEDALPAGVATLCECAADFLEARG